VRSQLECWTERKLGLKKLVMERFEIEPVFRSALPDVAGFLHRYRSNEAADAPVKHPPDQQSSSPRQAVPENALSIERRLQWLLLENPVAADDVSFGHCLRDPMGVIRGLNLSFPAAFLAGNHRLLGLCSGSFFVEPAARSLGFFLFKRYLGSPGYSFYFASTCNANSSEIWRKIGGCAVPHSDTEYILPLRLDVVMPAFVANRTSSEVLSSVARICGQGVNPLLRFLTRPSAQLAIEPCRDWQKLSDLARRHRSEEHITSDRSAAFLQWRYGPTSPLHPCGVYLLRDKHGNEGWFALGDLTRGDLNTGEQHQFREAVLLDAIWPRQEMNYSEIFREILRAASASADAIFFRWQPGLDAREYSRWVIPHRLPAPRAFVTTPRGAPHLALDSLDYDDSDYIAWRFQWTAG
jgi:hypothetical protein